MVKFVGQFLLGVMLRLTGLSLMVVPPVGALFLILALLAFKEAVRDA